MRSFAKGALLVVGIPLGSLVVALVVLSVIGLDPRERRPGLWLRGQLVSAPVTDWSFTDKYPNVFVQTRSWYGLPHSVTTTLTAHGSRIYLTSVYRPGAQFPRDRLWNQNVLRDPRVRLKIGEQVFDRRVTLVTDPAEKGAVLVTKARKYPRQRAADPSLVHVFRVEPS